MSYSGYREYICNKGHYFTVDEWDDEPKKCPKCGDVINYRHTVDQTNGYGENQRYIESFDYKNEEHKDCIFYADCDAPKKEIGFEDIEHKDKYGNVYYTDIKLYEPVKLHVWKRM